jgi:hypothetical protein
LVQEVIKLSGKGGSTCTSYSLLEEKKDSTVSSNVIQEPKVPFSSGSPQDPIVNNNNNNNNNTKDQLQEQLHQLQSEMATVSFATTESILYVYIDKSLIHLSKTTSSFTYSHLLFSL